MEEKLKKIWKNKYKIFEGIWRSWFPSAYVERIAKRRSEICRLNACGYYSPKGDSPKCMMPGKPCCAGCGCLEKYKVHSLSSYCYLKDIGKIPFWDAQMTESEEEVFREKTKLKNE